MFPIFSLKKGKIKEYNLIVNRFILNELKYLKKAQIFNINVFVM